MLTSFLILFVAFYALSIVAFVVSIGRAPEGYEDDRGFHFGLRPAPLMMARRRPAHRSPHSEDL